jgi:hypothetical protein
MSKEFEECLASKRIRENQGILKGKGAVRKGA